MFWVVYLVLTVFTATCNAEVLETAPLHGGRIVGGSDAHIYDFPHQVSIRYYGSHLCGGSINSENIVITSHSCVFCVYVILITAVAGSTFLSNRNIEIPVRKIIFHPSFLFTTKDYDVAVLILYGHLRFRSGVQPIPLAKERAPAGTGATVVGWGSLEKGYVLSNQLQKVNVNVMSKLDCFTSYTSFMTSRMVCATAPDGGKDPCYKDDGGPLIANNQLLGIIISYASSCGKAGQPEMYTSVPDVYEWIVETAQQNSNSVK